MEAIANFFVSTGFYQLFQGDNWKCAIMLVIAVLLLFLGIVKKFEPLLLVPIGRQRRFKRRYPRDDRRRQCRHRRGHGDGCLRHPHRIHEESVMCEGGSHHEEVQSQRQRHRV